MAPDQNTAPADAKPPIAWDRVAIAAAVFVVVIAVAGWFIFGRSSETAEPAPVEQSKPTYAYVSPEVPCCVANRTEATQSFTVQGPWKVNWHMDSTGKSCLLTGRILDDKTNAFTDLAPFGSGADGEQEYKRPGTYSIMLEYDCPPKSIARTQLHVYTSGV